MTAALHAFGAAPDRGRGFQASRRDACVIGAIAWGDIKTGNSRIACPKCRHDPRDRTCGVTLEPDGCGVAHCFRCGYVEKARGQKQSGRLSQASTAPRRRETLSEFGRKLWQACSPLAGDALAYLEARRCVVPRVDGHLRWHPALKHPMGSVYGPALVALVTDARTGAPLTLHRTWILAEGRKAQFDPPRMLLGGHRKAGGVVRLWPDETVALGLGVAEGIETALSLAHAYTPVWACIDAGNLAALPVLEGIESLLVAADHDDAGKAAAEACAERWVAAGRRAAIAMPPTPKADMNDLAAAT